MEYLEYILAILAGICTAIPLVIKLASTIRNYHREQNWPGLMSMVTKYMEEAETLFDNGADKKAWVMGMVQASANLVNYDIDMEVVSEMIDSLCAMSKKINAPVEEQVVEE